MSTTPTGPAPTGPAPTGPAPDDLGLRIQQYVAVRDKIKADNEAHEAKMKPLVEMQNLLSGRIQQHLDTHGIDSIKTAHGTAYATTRYTASLEDPAVFMRHVIGTEDWDLLDKRANATAAREFAEQNGGALPPGVKLSAIKTVGVRRPSAKD